MPPHPPYPITHLTSSPTLPITHLTYHPLCPLIHLTPSPTSSTLPPHPPYPITPLPYHPLYPITHLTPTPTLPQPCQGCKLTYRPVTLGSTKNIQMWIMMTNRIWKMHLPSTFFRRNKARSMMINKNCTISMIRNGTGTCKHIQTHKTIILRVFDAAHKTCSVHNFQNYRPLAHTAPQLLDHLCSH